MKTLISGLTQTPVNFDMEINLASVLHHVYLEITFSVGSINCCDRKGQTAKCQMCIFKELVVQKSVSHFHSFKGPISYFLFEVLM